MLSGSTLLRHLAQFYCAIYTKLAGWIHNHAGTPHFSPSWDCSSEIPDFMPACEAQAHNLTPAQTKKMGIVLP